ncbi:hypothetical protein [Floricoccus penangensis]|nr:hypothetical protein [Floricoccus penangensis]
MKRSERNKKEKASRIKTALLIISLVTGIIELINQLLELILKLK